MLQRRQSSSGRRREFEQLARKCQHEVFNAARRLTRTLADAEDLTQDAFVKAYVSFDQFAPGTNFRAWMLKILATMHVSQYRYQSRQPQTIAWETDSELDRERSPWHRSDDPGPEATIVAQELDEPVVEALAQVPDEFRSTIVLCDMFELSYREVADVLQIPLGTVRSRICRGRRILAEHLREYASKRGYL